MLKVLVADDEVLARKTLLVLLQDVSDIGEVREAEDGNTALRIALEFQPDIILLDVEMPGVNGLELASMLPAKSVVIFVTAYHQHAVRAFELNAVDYLLKPFDDSRFFEAINRAQHRLREGDEEYFGKVHDVVQEILRQQQKHYRERLVIRDPGRIRLVDVQQIRFITGAGNYAELHLNENKTILHRETLSALEQQLDPDVFVRIHRSSIVRRNCICELRPNDKGDYSVILDSGDELTLSRRNRNKLDQITL